MDSFVNFLDGTTVTTSLGLNQGNNYGDKTACARENDLLRTPFPLEKENFHQSRESH
jgi:hypothetical protein